jgi:hypothetical protein
LRQDTDFDGQREAFCEKVDNYLSELSTAPATERLVVAKDWRERLRRDREGLRKDLRRAKIEVLLDKDSAVGLIAAGGLGAGGALVGGLVGGPIGALIGLVWE